MKKLLILFLSVLSFNVYSQLDSTVTYINDTAKYKAVYESAYTYFYRKDTLNRWFLYGKWYETETEIYFYSYDSLGIEYLTTIMEWTEHNRYFYHINDDGVKELHATTTYYDRTYIPTETSYTQLSNINVYEYDYNITISSDDILLYVKLYDVTGRLLVAVFPNSTQCSLTAVSGILFVKVKTNKETAIKKLIVY